MPRKSAAETLPEIPPVPPEKSAEPRAKRSPGSRKKELAKEVDQATEDVVADIRRRLAGAEQTDESAMAEVQAEIAEHQSKADNALNAARRIRAAVADGDVDKHRSWEFFHELHNYDIELKAAIERSWRRPLGSDSAEAEAERLNLSEALDAIEGTIDDVRTAVERAQNLEGSGVYDEALAAAQAKWHEAITNAQDIKDALRDDALAPKDRDNAIHAFVEKETEIEDVTDRAYKASGGTSEKPRIQETAEYEAAARADAEIQATIHELLLAEFEQGRREPTKSSDARSRLTPDVPVWQGVAKLVAEIRALHTGNRLDIALHEEILKDLAEREHDLSLDLERARQTDGAVVSETTQRIAGALHLIEDLRHELGTAEHLPAESHAPETALAAWRLEKEARLADIARQQKRLLDRIHGAYGKSPEELASMGWSFAHLGNRLLKDTDGALDRWRALDREREEIQQELEPALAGRGERGEGAARAKAAATTERQVEEAFFEGSMEQPGSRSDDEQTVEVEVDEINEALEMARTNGVRSPEDIYANILTNPAVELLSFSPEDYLKQLARVNEAKTEAKEANFLTRYAAERRAAAARALLREMRSELRDCGIETGETGKKKKTRKKKSSSA